MNENINPNDVVKRALLLMKYDSSQTLTENKQVIFEQEGCPNSISREEFLELAKETIEEMIDMDTTLVRMVNQVKSAQLVYDNIKRISEHKVYDSLDNTCKDGISELKRNFKHYYTTLLGNDAGGLFANSTLLGVLSDFKTGYYSDVPEVLRYLNATIKIVQNPPKVGGESNDEKLKKAKACGYNSWDEYKGAKWVCPKKGGDSNKELTSDEKLNRAKACGHNSWDAYKKANWSCTKKQGGGGQRRYRSQFKECSGTYSVGCKSEVIRKVQGCLGITTDGLFGSRTKNAINTKIGKTSFTDADVNTICGTTVQTTIPVKEPEEINTSTTNINDFLTGI